MAEIEWPPLSWSRYGGKHRCPRNADWHRVVDGTLNGPARYHPEILEKTQRDWEMHCVANVVMINEDDSVRSYYMDMGRTIGADRGQEVTFLYAERKRAAGENVHGRPICLAGLRERGVQI